MITALSNSLIKFKLSLATVIASKLQQTHKPTDTSLFVVALAENNTATNAIAKKRISIQRHQSGAPAQQLLVQVLATKKSGVAIQWTKQMLLAMIPTLSDF